jgi:GNAT superfamily N-acetyltransferase
LIGENGTMRTLRIGENEIVIRPGRWEEIIDLRHAVLRHGLPREEAIFPGDELPTSRHWVALADSVVVGCATLHANQWEGERAWQLRGMATLPEFRGKGLGRALLEGMEAEFDGYSGTGGGALLWCNARVPAVGFYRSMGWLVVSGQFEIPTAGPHVRMVKRLVG